MSKLKNRFLLASVFMTGAVVLIVEILAMRILSPYYGNTIYATSAIISTILAALSLGYYFGGILSDKQPHHAVFYGLIFLSGFLILLTHLLSLLFLPILSPLFSISLGPVVASLFLFFAPAFFLGMLSPFAIKLSNQNTETIGQQSGKVFFWSTLGSIIGSLLAGFILIPHLGINNIMVFAGLFLIVWGLVGFLFFQKLSKITLLGVIFLFIFLVSFVWFCSQRQSLNLVYEHDGIYEKIRIMDGVWQDRPARYLLLDRSNSSAIYLDSPELVFDYTKYYKLYQLFKPEPNRVLVIGGGAYSIPKAILTDSQSVQVDVAETEPSLFNLAQEYFGLQNDDRLHNYIEDGRRFLTKNSQIYDTIISDVYYSFFSIPPHFTTKEFFALAKNRLTNNGIFVGNFAGSLEKQEPSFIWSEIKTFKAIFPNSYFFAVQSPKLLIPQNIIFLGINGDKKINFSSDVVLKNSDPIIKTLAEKTITIDETQLSPYTIITDDFAPVEYLVGKSLAHWY